MPKLPTMSADVYFSAGRYISAGGPRPTPCDADYDSPSQRFVRPRAYDYRNTPTQVLPGALNMNMYTWGLRATAPLVDIGPFQTSNYGKSGPWYGARQQNPMNIVTPLKIQPMTKVTG